MRDLIRLFRESVKISFITVLIFCTFIALLMFSFSYLHTIVDDTKTAFSSSYKDVQSIGSLLSETEVLNHRLDSYLFLKDEGDKYANRRKVRDSITKIGALRYILKDDGLISYIGNLLLTGQDVILSRGDFASDKYLEFTSQYEIVKFRLQELQHNILFEADNNNRTNLLNIIYYMLIALISIGIVAFFIIVLFLMYRKANKSERLLRTHLSDVLDSMPSMLISCDKSLVILTANKLATGFAGCDNSCITGKDISIHFPMIVDLKSAIQEHFERGEIFVSNKIIHHSQDEINVYQVTAYPLHIKEFAYGIIRIDDITSKAKMEEILFQSEKMMSVGGLAAGIAHEINNPLVGIVQTAEVLENRLFKLLPANVRAAEALAVDFSIISEYMQKRKIGTLLNNMRESGERISRIINNMLRFARKDNDEPEIVDLSELCNKTIDLASVEYNLKKKYDFRKIQIQKEFTGSSFSAKCKPGLLQQVILNILRNGAQAMYEYTDNPCFTIKLFADKGYVNLYITDNGPGITEANKKHIFEPFYTTKEKGIGTGIGLSVSHYIITEEMHGKLEIESEEGQGASFQLSLPLIRIPQSV